MLETGSVLRAALVLLTLGSVASRGSACTARGEELPGPEVYVSGNGLFAVAIVPRPLESRPGGGLQAVRRAPHHRALRSRPRGRTPRRTGQRRRTVPGHLRQLGLLRRQQGRRRHL